MGFRNPGWFLRGAGAVYLYRPVLIHKSFDCGCTTDVHDHAGGVVFPTCYGPGRATPTVVGNRFLGQHRYGTSPERPDRRVVSACLCVLISAIHETTTGSGNLAAISSFLGNTRASRYRRALAYIGNTPQSALLLC